MRSDRALLVFDQTSRSWQQPQNVTSLSVDQRSLIAADLVETGRDLVEELDRRGSPIRRILDDLDIAAGRRTELEDGLRELGGEIITSSGSLAALQVAFESLSRSVDTMGLPSLQPLPIRLEELARSVSIDLDTGNGGLPVRFHGAGARSLTSMQVQGVLYDRRLGRDGPALRPHPISLIEEPEAHLHPQAQFELPMLLDHIQGQVIVSTHSTHFVSVVDPRSIRLLRRSGARRPLWICDQLKATTVALQEAGDLRCTLRKWRSYDVSSSGHSANCFLRLQWSSATGRLSEHCSPLWSAMPSGIAQTASVLLIPEA